MFEIVLPLWAHTSEAEARELAEEVTQIMGLSLDAQVRVAPKHYRIFDPEGEHVATVAPEQLAETLDAYNARRELNIDGDPIGEYTATPYNGFVQGDS